ncbi:MAG TPA: tetratricopeptide repeat protein [Myxococcota bacterium]|nr:tetratricopeptide repeat protein [Myxococcota bacterium]
MTTLARVLAVAVGLAALPAVAADEGPVLRQRAEQLAAGGRCEEALPRARRARELDPRDSRAALIEGRCLLRLGQYRESIAPLEAARELDPNASGVATDLGQAHYHLDEIDAASAELDRAERENPNDARTQLYRGLVLSRQAKQREAGAAFDRASALDPGLTGMAALYAGRSYASAQEREKAKAALERARAAEPDSEWGRTAAHELEVLDLPNRRHAWAQLRAGVEHDSNVTLQNNLPYGPFQIQQDPNLAHAHEKENTVGVFEAEGGLEFLRDEEQSAGAAIGYSGNAHDTVTELDLQYPWATFWYDRRLSEKTWARLQPFFGYAWLDANPYDVLGGATASISHEFTGRFTGDAYTRVMANDFRYHLKPDPVVAVAAGPATAERFRRFRNRDGVEYAAGVEGRFAVVPASTTLRAGSEYQRYESEGRDWEYDGSRTWIGVTQALPWRFVFDVLGSYGWYPYDHTSSYDENLLRYLVGKGPDREDQIWDVQGELRYPVTDWLEVSARGQYTDAESNVRVFDYDRWIAGGYLTMTWGHTL